MNRSNTPGWLAAYEKIRTDGYAMLAALLTQPPSAVLLKMLGSLEWEDALPGKLGAALDALRRAGPGHEPGELEQEYHRLFVGLGRGEMVPYSSWYREGKMMSLPLVSLRSALRRFGIVKREDRGDSEDHAGALCEVMTLLSAEPDGASRAEQREFFRRHIATWMPAFFKDLRSAQGAGFYRAVGVFGGSFLETEGDYFRYGAGNELPAAEGGGRDET